MRNHHDCTGPPGVSSPSPRPEPLAAGGYETSVPARPCRSGRRARLGRPGEVSLPSVASPPRAGGGTGSGHRAPLVCAPPPPPLTGVCVTRLLGARGYRPPRPGVLWLALRAPRRRSGVGARRAAGGHIAGTRGCPWCPRAQQYRTPLCDSAHALHGGCPCALHTHVFRRRLCVSGLCCRVCACCGVKCMVCGSWLPFSGPVSTT